MNLVRKQCPSYSSLIFMIFYTAFVNFAWAAGEGPDFTHAQPVIADDGNTQKNLKQAPFEGLHTTILYGANGLVRTDSSKVFALYGGTGANSRTYGIGTSLAHIANKIYKLKGDPIGFLNPQYFGDDKPDLQRSEFVKKFGNLEAQEAWMAATLEYVVSQAGKKPVWVATRSTGTAVLMQLIRDYLRGKPEAKVIGSISGVLLTGILPHEEKQFTRWLALEKSHLMEKGFADEEVIDHESSIFLPMDFAPLVASTPIVNPGVTTLPKILAIVGANDPLTPAVDQLLLLQKYSELHPQLDISVLATDVYHNSASSLRYTDTSGMEVKLRTMERMGPIIQEVMAQTDSPPSAGLHLYADSAFWKVPGSCQAPLAVSLLAGARPWPPGKTP